MPKKKPRLSRAAWIEAALEVLEEGIDAVAVEPLARQLGVTKGSFYWHFKNRDALLADTLDLWEQRSTEAIIADVSQHDTPRAVLTALARRGLSEREHMRIEVVLAGAADHPVVRPMLQRVMERRRTFVAGMLQQMGYATSDVSSRSLLTYASFLGLAQLLEIDESLAGDEDALVRNWVDMVLGPE